MIQHGENRLWVCVTVNITHGHVQVRRRLAPVTDSAIGQRKRVSAGPYFCGALL